MLLKKLPLHLLPPRAVLLATDIILLVLPEGEEARSSFLADAEPPYGSVDIVSSSGPGRIAALRASKRLLEGELSAFGLGTEIPLVFADIAELAADLDAASRFRLLSFLLGFCRKAFDLSAEPSFVAACLRLTHLCEPLIAQAEPVACISSSWLVIEGLDVVEPSVFIASDTRIRRVQLPTIDGHPSLRVIERLVPGEVVLALSSPPVIGTIDTPRAVLRDLLRPQPGADKLRTACLAALAPVCPTVAAHLREQILLAPATPIGHDDPRQPLGAALDVGLPDGAGRVFLRGWLRDPMQLIRSAELRSPVGHVPVTLSELHRFPRPDIDKRFAGSAFADTGSSHGFVAHLADPSPGFSIQPTLVLHLHSGARVAVRAPMRHPTPAECRTAVLTSVQPGDASQAMLETCLFPAASAFHRASFANRAAPDRILVGTPVEDPAVTIIVPLYRTLGFLRFQFAALAADPMARSSELVFVLDSPEQRQECEHLLRGLHAMHGLSFTLLVQPRNLGYAATNNAGALVARAPRLLLLNSDVVPSRTGWLASMIRALDAEGIGAVGPKLLFDDDSIQHAGLLFQLDADGTWLNAHFHKGMPRFWPGAARARLVPGVTGAALLVRRDLFERACGMCEDYIVGDYEDSDFCLRLRQAGAEIAYEPAAELYHFERRSIGLHRGYAGTLACRYNQALHHRRWSDAIADLMDRPEFSIFAAAEAA